MKEKRKFRLFAALTGEKAEKAAFNARFYRVTPTYTLVYSDKTELAGFIELALDDLHRLTAQDSIWLAGCNLQILAESQPEDKSALAEVLNEKLDLLEQALDRERKIVEGET